MSLTDSQLESLRSYIENPIFWWAAGISFLVFALCSCRIFARTGYHAAMGLLMFVPGLNVLMVLVLAFGPWPVMKEMRNLRRVEKKVRRAADRFTNAA